MSGAQGSVGRSALAPPSFLPGGILSSTIELEVNVKKLAFLKLDRMVNVLM